MDASKGFALSALAALGFLFLLLAAPFSEYLFSAVLLAYLLVPLQRRLSRRVGPRTAALAIVTAATVALVAPVALLLRIAALQALALAGAIRSGELNLFDVDRRLEALLGRPVDTSELAAGAEATATGTVGGEGEGASYLGEAVGLLGVLAETALGLFLVAFLLYYLLQDGPALVAWLHRATPLPRPMRLELHEAIDTLLWGILVGNVLVALIQGLLTGVGLAVVGLPNVVFWTTMATFLAFLPVVGASVVWIPAAAYLLATGQVGSAAFLALYGTFVISLSDNFLRGIVGGRSARMNPAAFTVGVFGGLVAFGFVGVFVGPLVVGTLRAAVEVFAREYSPHYGEPPRRPEGGTRPTAEGSDRDDRFAGGEPTRG